MSLWERMRSGASRAAQEAAQEAKKQALLARLAMQVNDAKGERRRKTEALGEAVLALLRAGDFSHPSVEGLYADIGQLEVRIAALEGQIAEVKAGGAPGAEAAEAPAAAAPAPSPPTASTPASSD